MKNNSTFKRAVLLFLLSLFFLSSEFSISQTKTEPLKIGVVGLSHSHVGWILGRPDKGDMKIVGIVEPNKDLAERYSKHFGYSMDIVFNTIKEMIEATEPEAVTAFGSIYQHLEVVETCAPLGIHVMVEKPLAVSMEHALKMEALAKKHNIQLLTNYETTWYATNHKAYKMVENSDVGDLRKIVVRDGHQGPKEIGVNKEFLEWLTDPVLNGGGALVDFGCYGANLITWLTKGKKPEAVMAMTQTNKPAIYPNVDDEATIVLQYPKMQGIIQASWNWPMSRKDMEIYGETGYVYSDNAETMRYRISEKEAEQKEVLTEVPNPYDDPFAMFEKIIRNKITLPPYDLPSLENNMIVVEILDAAKKSAATGKKVQLDH